FPVEPRDGQADPLATESRAVRESDVWVGCDAGSTLPDIGRHAIIVLALLVGNPGPLLSLATVQKENSSFFKSGTGRQSYTSPSDNGAPSLRLMTKAEQD